MWLESVVFIIASVFIVPRSQFKQRSTHSHRHKIWSASLSLHFILLALSCCIVYRWSRKLTKLETENNEKERQPKSIKIHLYTLWQYTYRLVSCEWNFFFLLLSILIEISGALYSFFTDEWNKCWNHMTKITLSSMELRMLLGMLMLTNSSVKILIWIIFFHVSAF